MLQSALERSISVVVIYSILHTYPKIKTNQTLPLTTFFQVFLRDSFITLIMQI